MNTISRRDFVLGCSGVAGMLSFWPFGRFPPKPARRKNVLFIVVDDLKPLLGAYGVRQALTPNMDHLAASGTVFKHCYCQQAICGPSRASFLTGLRPDDVQVHNLTTFFRTHKPDAVTMPQFFRQQGYAVEGMGKIFHGNADEKNSWDTWWGDGTDKPFDYAGTELRAACDRAKEEGTKLGLKGRDLILYVKKNAPRPATECADVTDEAYGDGGMALKAIERLSALKNPDKPFFLAVGFIRPHLPFSAPKKYWDLYDPAELPMPAWRKAPEGAPPYAVHPSWEVREFSDYPKNVQPPDQPEAFTEEQERHLLHGYYASTSYVDAQIGKVLDALDRQGLREETVVCLLGDHGWHLGDHGMWGKFTNYEEATRSPLIIRDPDRTEGGSCEATTEFVDVYPTLCDLAGLTPPQALAGVSLAGLMDHPGRKHDRPAFSQYPREENPGTPQERKVMGYSLRTPRYRYTEWVHNPGWKDGLEIRHSAPGNEVLGRELYDYQTDPQETRNLISDPLYEKVSAELARRMQQRL
jgi:arylsulfatase A-like enzyme